MNTIKIFLAESGRVADLKKDFPLYQGQFQNKLLNIFCPTSIIAPSFTSQSASGVVLADYVASTSVKIGMTYTARDGSIKVSKNYYMRYLKTLTIQGVEYALYERKLPQEFTLYAGQGANAPILIANVVNIQQQTEDGTPIILSVITSQTCALDVMPSTNLDQDESIEPTELENINAQINEINEILPTKQDKVDEALETESKSVVGAINENKGKIDTNITNIATNTENIAKNTNDIDWLKQNMAMSENYIGQLTGDKMPTDTELTNFVIAKTSPSREPRNGDVIIFVLKIEGATDRNFKYFYTASGWQYYEIPPIETAGNGSAGIVEGTYGVGETYDTLVDISGGQIVNIYIKDGSGNYRNLVEYLNTTTGNITNIINGTTTVGVALKAISDGVGNNIVDTYLTKALGVSKQRMRDYAMPRVFNDVDFIATAGFQDTVPTTPESGIQFTTDTSAVGDFQLFQISKTNTADFELSSKNGSSNNIYISASIACVVTFRLTTQYKKAGEDWADLNIELTSPITFTAGEIQKVMFGNPFSSLNDKVIKLTDGDLIRQTLEVIVQTSTPITFNVYSNEVYPSIFNLTSQSYTFEQVEENVGKLIQLGLDGVIESGKVVFEVQNADSYMPYRTNLREFFINAHLPVVVPTFQSLDPTLPVAITFGDTSYNLYNYLLGAETPLTVGNLMSVATYNQTTGFFFNFKATFFENSDIVGFGIIPPAVIATQIEHIIEDTETVVTDLSTDGTKLSIHLSADVVNKLAKALVLPTSAPTHTELVAITANGQQTMIDYDAGFIIKNGTLKFTKLAPFVSYTDAQDLTDKQKAQARANIGAGASGFSGSYTDLTQKPILNTANETSQTANANETIENTVNLHKISKTGALADSIQDSTHRTVTDTEKADWNNTNFSRLTNVPQASTSTAGIIQIATDTEAENGTNETKAINPKQLLTAIQGLGSVFTIKGSVATKNDLPATGNTIGDVWYVIDESVGYIWLNDGTTDRWEQLGVPIDLSTYMQFSDVINNLTSDNIDKPLSAYQGKVLKAFIDSIQTALNTETTNRENADTNLQTAINNITNNTTKIASRYGGFAGGYKAKVELAGGAVGLGASSSSGGAVGNEAKTNSGGAIGFNALATSGFSGGFMAISEVDSIQLGNGTNTQEKTLQVYDDNLYNANTHQLSSALLNAIYPVGSVYISVNTTSPASLFGGEWEELPANNALWTTATSSANAGTTISAGLPNITGTVCGGDSDYRSGAFVSSVQNGSKVGSGSAQFRTFTFDASKSSSIYGNSSTVQPPAIQVIVWKRTA